MATPTNALTVSDYMRKPEIIQRFSEVLGNEAQANSYVQSVLILVSSNDDLMACTPRSIYTSAMRAASLGLSCDPALKQAWIVSYNKKIKAQKRVVEGKEVMIPEHWEKQAQFQPHYKGLRTLAMRTGKYWIINVSEIYEGQRVLYNPLTGLYVVQESNGFVGEPKAANPAYIDVTDRRKKEMKVKGWLAYYKTKKGEEKSVYMSCAEIDDHARKYVKDYEKNPNWNDPDKRSTMEMKTVLKQLLSWADLSGEENKKLAEALQSETDAEPEFIDAPSEDVASGTDLHPMNIDEARQTIGIINGKEKQLGNCTSDELNYVYLNSMKNNAVEAARIILIEDFRMDPPQTEKKSADQLQKELGF